MVLEFKRTGEAALTATKAELEGIDKAFEKTKQSAFSFSDFLQGMAQGAGQKAFSVLLQGIEAIPSALQDAVVGFVNAGGALADLSAKTTLGTTALQEYAYAGSLVGVSSDAIASSVLKMTRTIGEGGEKTEDAVRSLGLSFADLRAMRPEEQFRAVAAAIHDVDDPTRQLVLGTQLMGKSFSEILPLIRSDFEGLRDEAHALGAVMSEDMVASADAAGDAATRLGAAWEGFKNQIGAAIVNMSGGAAGLDNLAKSMAGFTAATSDNESIGNRFLAFLIKANPLILQYGLLMKALEKPGAMMGSKPLPGSALSFAMGLEGGEATGFSSLEEDLEDLINKGLKEYTKDTKEAAAAARKAAAEFDKLGKAFDDMAKKAEEGLLKEWLDKDRESMKAWIEGVQSMQDELAMMTSKGMQGVGIGSGGLFASKEVAAEMDKIVDAEAAAVREAEAWAKTIEQVANGVFAIADAFSSFGGLGAGIGNLIGQLGDAFMELKDLDVGKLFGGLSGKGGIGGLFSSLGGFGVIAQMGKGIFDAVKGLFGNAEIEKRIAEWHQLEDQIISTYGSLEDFAELARRWGVDMSLAMNPEDPDALKRAMEQLNAVIEQTKENIENLGKANDLLLERAQILTAQIELTGEATDAQKESFRRLGTYALGVFSQLVANTGDVLGALLQMGPTLDQISASARKYGIEMGAAFGDLARLNNWVKKHQELAAEASNLNQLFQIFGDLNMLNGEILQDLAADVTALFDKMVAGGLSANDTLAMLAPSLQQLWEQQQRTGVQFDESTQRLLDAAVGQGVVGDQFKDTFSQILDVLLVIADVLGAQIPGYLDNLANQARNMPPLIPPLDGGRFETGGVDHGGGIPGHASGYFNPSLPYDYIFKAHQGERVEITPASQTAARNAGGGTYSLSIPMTIHTQPGQDPEAFGRAAEVAIEKNIRRRGSIHLAIQDAH